MNLDPAELARLGDKYAQLISLRRERAAGLPPPPKASFVALSRAYPGALLELDTLPLDELEARAAALHAAAQGGAVEPWMRWIGTYHALLRVGLALARRAAFDAVEARAIAAREGVEVDAELLGRLASPQGGRRVPLVLAEIARRAGVSVEEVTALVRPSRRPPADA